MKKYYPRPLWFWNCKPTAEKIEELMQECARCDGYAGFGILPFDACELQYMSEEYLSLYRVALEKAKELGLKICLYDEWWFPSGWAGGLLQKKYPEACAKRLDSDEVPAARGKNTITVPQDGKLMAAVFVSEHGRTDVENCIKKGTLCFEADSDGTVMFFMLRNANWNHVDYLNAERVKKFIEVTHEAYYKAFSEYFSTVIDSVFYDEPQFYGAAGRMWTESFNARFEQKYGFSPTTLYPALFYDIGKDTAFARNALLSVRADMYAEGFVRTVQEWCTAHGVTLTGHVDQEEVPNPAGMTGDLMKSFMYQDIPGVDEIAFCKRASKAYKIVSSSAVNFDKRLVMTECFGAMPDLDADGMYREAYDLFTKGINYIVPHAVWLSDDPEKVVFKPELSYRNSKFKEAIPPFNAFCARLSEALQTRVAVNSVGVLYPIESLYSEYTFNWGGDPYLGGPTWDKNDYMELGEYLMHDLACDFTFVHPDALANAVVEKGEIRLRNTSHVQNYKIIFLPGMRAVSAATMEKLCGFVESGGIVIATCELPRKSAERGRDADVQSYCKQLFGRTQIGTAVTVKEFNGGYGVCIPPRSYAEIKRFLAMRTLDTHVVTPSTGLQYIHKRGDDDVWLFYAGENDADTLVRLDGKYELTAVDPMDGKQIPLCTKSANATEFKLQIKKDTGILIYGKHGK